MLKKYLKNMVNAMGYDVHRVIRPESMLPGRLPSSAIPTTPIDAIVKNVSSLHLVEMEATDGNVSLVELLVINSLIASRSAGVLFEIGTFDGRTSLNMLSNAIEGAVLYTLDLPSNEVENTGFALHEFDKKYVIKARPGERFLGTTHEKQITQLFGDSAKFDFSPYYGKAEVIFVDGSHAYDYVKNDSVVAQKVAAKSGLIIWHDYGPCWAGVIQALEELYASGGVFRKLRNIEGTTLVILDMALNE